MLVKQISVFLENKTGRLADATNCLAEAGIDLRAMSVADTASFGVLRIIVNDPEQAITALKNCGFTVSTTEVIAVLVPDQPGGLAEVLRVFKEQLIDIEYMYAFISTFKGQAIVILKIDDALRAVNILTEHQVEMIQAQEFYTM